MEEQWVHFARPISVKFTTYEGTYIRGFVLAWHVKWLSQDEVNYIAYLMDDGQLVDCPTMIEWYE